VVITIARDHRKIEFFISLPSSTWEQRLHYTTMTHDRPSLGKLVPCAIRHLHGVEPARRPKRFQSGESGCRRNRALVAGLNSDG